MIKVSAMLSGLLIPEIAEVTGGRFKFPDRLTRVEAVGVLLWGKSQPELRRAFVDKGHKFHELARLYHHLATYYAREHPQDSQGAPVAWPARATPLIHDPANPFAHCTPEEAEAVLAWAPTNRRFAEAYYDKSHKDHAGIVQRMQRLREIAHSAPAAAREAPAAAARLEVARPPAEAPAAISADLQRRIAEARKDPAYWNKMHPGHAAAVERVSALYRAAYPDKSGGGSALPAASGTHSGAAAPASGAASAPGPSPAAPALPAPTQAAS